MTEQQPMTQFEDNLIKALRAFWKQNKELLNQNQELIQQVSRLADVIDRLAPGTSQAPNYQRSLEAFAHFDWSSIGAEVERSDQYGATFVNWRGQQFMRRAPSNKFDSAIWFSRCVGKDENGNNKYERLISFKKISEVEPIPEKTLHKIAVSSKSGSF